MDISAAIKAALAPDHFSRSAYTGQVTQTEKVRIIADDGTTFEKEVTFYISWDSIQKILEMVRNRAKL